MAGARRGWGSLSQLKSLSPPMSVSNGFREWSFENPAKPMWPLMLVSVAVLADYTVSCPSFSVFAPISWPQSGLPAFPFVSCRVGVFFWHNP